MAVDDTQLAWLSGMVLPQEAALQDPVEESYINFGRMLKA